MKKNLLSLKLIYLRKQKGYTQCEVSEILNISRSTLSKYEKGTRIPNLKTIIKLANLYNVSCDYLLSKDNI